jgi:hypothetical protein
MLACQIGAGRFKLVSDGDIHAVAMRDKQQSATL